MQVLKIDVGLHTAKKFDLSQVNLERVESIIFTVKNGTDDSFPEIIRREIKPNELDNGRYNAVITCEESLQLTRGAVYDFVKKLDNGECYKLGRGNGTVELVYGVGRCTSASK